MWQIRYHTHLSLVNLHVCINMLSHKIRNNHVAIGNHTLCNTPLWKVVYVQVITGYTLTRIVLLCIYIYTDIWLSISCRVHTPVGAYIGKMLVLRIDIIPFHGSATIPRTRHKQQWKNWSNIPGCIALLIIQYTCHNVQYVYLHVMVVIWCNVVYVIGHTHLYDVYTFPT